MREYEIGFYVRVRWPGVSAWDAQHRAEGALRLWSGRRLTHDAGKRGGGVTEGEIRVVSVLHLNESPE